MEQISYQQKFLKFLTSLVDIAYITIGITYHGSCTKGRSLPFYLVICGSCDLAFTMISLIPQTRIGWDRSKGWRSFSLSHSFIEQWESFPEQINFALFAAGNVLLYSIYEPDYNREHSPEYCDKSLYLFALYTHLISYIIYLILIFCNYWHNYKMRQMILRGQRSYQSTISTN